MRDRTVVVKTRNVLAFSLNPALFSVSLEGLQIEGHPMHLQGQVRTSELLFVLRDHEWIASQNYLVLWF